MSNFTEEEKRLVATVRVGEETREFLATTTGRLLHGKAKQDIAAARDELETCDIDTFWGRRKFRRLQKQIAVARQFENWCAEALIDGENAYHTLVSQE